MFGMDEIKRHFKAEAERMEKARAAENAAQLAELVRIRKALEALVNRFQIDDNIHGRPKDTYWGPG